MNIIPVSFCLLMATALAHTAVEWESTALEFFPEISEASIAGEYRFTVTGDAPVSIANIVPGCGGCTVAKLTKSEFQPGERGSVSFTFNTAGYEGLTRKKITVVFSDQQPQSVLEFSVTVPYVFQASPRVLSWPVGGALDPKTITLSSNLAGVSVESLLYDQSKFLVEKTSDGTNDTVCRLTITPTTTKVEIKERIFVRSNIVINGIARETKLYLLIQAKP